MEDVLPNTQPFTECERRFVVEVGLDIDDPRTAVLRDLLQSSDQGLGYLLPTIVSWPKYCRNLELELSLPQLWKSRIDSS
ncbi:MAG: hypothetical protein B7Z29_18545 [Hyphomicrobium sp. 12-62-95]|nr:MAG: hypothetical protein B7Z29_18545 [Hyphomicrobium sp. 12-62-95]